MTQRLTLEPTVTRFDAERFFTTSGWHLHDVTERTETTPYEEIWLAPGRAAAAHYIEDELIAVSYLLVMGEEEERLASELRSQIPIVDPHSAAADARSAADKEGRLRGIAYLASAAPAEADADLTAAFDELLRDPDPEIRQGALFAATYPSWPELDPLLERVRSGDPEPHLRAAADQTLAAIRRHRNGGGS